MSEAWSVRWYTPLLVAGGALLVLLMLALATVEVLTATVPEAVAPRTWTTPLGRMEAALGDGNTRAALSWWHEADATALRSGQWEGMIEVGAAARRFTEGAGLARRAYLTALFRARQERSLDGMLRAAAAFGELGDRDALAQALRLAAREAGPDPGAQARVRTVATRWMPTLLPPEGQVSRRPGGHQRQ